MPNRNLGERNIRLAASAYRNVNMNLWILDESEEHNVSRDDIDETTRDFLDFGQGISGDDLARITAFGPAAPNIKPIGEQRGIHSGTKIIAPLHD